MDWQLKPLARHSTMSGHPFTPGDAVVCLIHKNDAGELQRSDLLESELDHFTTAALVLGRWTRIVKEPEDEAREAREQQLASSEDLFLSFYAEDAVADDPDRDVLKQLLALLLERRRVLKARGRPVQGIQLYWHSRTQREYPVPVRDFDPDQLARIQGQLDMLIV